MIPYEYEHTIHIYYNLFGVHTIAKLKGPGCLCSLIRVHYLKVH